MKNITSVITIVSLLMVFLLTGLLSMGGLEAASLPVPQGVAANSDGSTFIVKWQNPAGMAELSQSAYADYQGQVYYVIDWRVNGGSWHYDREIPAGQDLMDCYGDALSSQFAGMLNDISADGKIVSQSVIDKVVLGVPYTTPVAEWLKSNSAEFRVRYIYTYWDETTEQLSSQHSPFSNCILLGSTNPAGETSKPNLIGYGVPEAPSAIEAPQQLVSEPLTLNLGWRVPESIKTLNTMDLYETDALVDWKLNNGEWHDALKLLEEGDVWLYRRSLELPLDRNDSVQIYLDRAALKIPYDIPLSVWLQDKTYCFRVRYIVRVPLGHSYKTIISPYSNTAVLGKGVKTNVSPQSEVPAGIDSSYYKNASSWAVPELDRAVTLGLVVDSIKGNMQQNITREEFAETALKLYECITGETKPALANPFADTSNPSVISAAQLGIVAGTSRDKFSPQALLTREQLGVMLHRIILLCDSNAGTGNANAGQFQDEADISPFARDAMGFMAQNDIMKGANGCINPRGQASREQAVATAIRVYDKYRN